MLFRKITKAIPFLLLLFIFSCGENKCSYLGDISTFQSAPQTPKNTPTWLSNLPKLLSQSVVDRLFGKAITEDGKTIASVNILNISSLNAKSTDPVKGLIGSRQMIYSNPQSDDVVRSPEKAVVKTIDKDRGTVYAVYAGIVRSDEYRATYYLGLTLYIVILGLTYLLGMTELTLTKSIPIFIKVGIISLFTNPTLSGATGMPIGWSAYYSVIVSPSIYAMEAFAMYFCSALFEMDINNVNDGFAPLAVMLSFMFNNIFWAKMSVLIFSGMPMGFATFIIVLVSMVIYVISAVLSIMSYMVIIATLGVLFAVGPIFFIFLLFEKTKLYFERWWKQILALMFQQYTLFIAISVFGFLIIKCAQAMLSFDVYCKQVIHLKLIGFIDIPLFYYYAADIGDSGSLTLAMYALFFFMLTSIYATSIEKIADASSGMIEGITGVGSQLGMANAAWKTISTTAQGLAGNAIQSMYQSPDKAVKSGVNAYSAAKNSDKLNDPTASGWDKFKEGLGIATGAASDLNPFTNNTRYKDKDGKDQKRDTTAVDRLKDVAKLGNSMFASDKKPDTSPTSSSDKKPDAVADANPSSQSEAPARSSVTIGEQTYDIPKDAYVVKDGQRQSMVDYINSVKSAEGFDINAKLPENVVFSGANTDAGYEYGKGSGARTGNAVEYSYKDMMEMGQGYVQAPVGGGSGYN